MVNVNRKKEAVKDKAIEGGNATRTRDLRKARFGAFLQKWTQRLQYLTSNHVKVSVC